MIVYHDSFYHVTTNKYAELQHWNTKQATMKHQMSSDHLCYATQVSLWSSYVLFQCVVLLVSSTRSLFHISCTCILVLVCGNVDVEVGSFLLLL